MSEPGTGTAGKIEVAIVVSDLDNAVAFYEGAVGLTYVADWELPGGLMKRFQFGDAIIKLIGFEEAPKSSGPGGMMAGVTGFRYLTLAVDDVAAMQQRVMDAGFNVAIPMFEFRPGLHIAIVEDPDGNWIEFVPAST
jgi:predicted enzyme related to lactoylglutathione lyase